MSTRDFPRRSTRTRSASRGTDTTPFLPQCSSQPTLRSACFSPRILGSISPLFHTLTQPSPKVSRRRNVSTTPISIPTLLDNNQAIYVQPEVVPCGVCNFDCEGENVIGCEGACYKWFHIECVNMSHSTFINTFADKASSSWFCPSCMKIPPYIPTPAPFVSILPQNITWGKSTLSEFEENIKSCYKEIVKWKKNLFLLPTGRVGKEFILEMKRLVDLFVNKTPYCNIALNALMVMIPLLLQKPSKNSKCSDHTKYLQKRLVLWKEGNILDILRECRVIQERLSKIKPKQDPDQARKIFVKLMLEGKVSSAMRWLDTQCSKGSLNIDEEVIDNLKKKHPSAQPCSSSDLLKGPHHKVEEVLFDQIDGHSIYRATLSTKGSGGPTYVDSDAWKRFLCSKSFGNSCKELCDSIAMLARILSTEHIPSEMLEFYTAGRLVALDKCPGETPLQVRPIGIGEVLRRIVGKSVMIVLKPEITQAAGPLQACAGHKGGVEAAVHAMKQVFDEPDTEAVILVDASNAFNSMNRQTALHNIQIICPEMATYLINTYRSPPSLFIAKSNGTRILSEEGCTQGDNAGMAFYACNTLPLITMLHHSNSCKQAWFADDSAAAGKLEEIKVWWDSLNKNGPTMGYYPNPGKTWLILKNENIIEKSQRVFDGTGVNITSFGKKHLGAVLGSVSSKQQFVTQKVEDWVNHLKTLSLFAKTDPHAAYAAFTYGFIQKWKYVQRTIPDIGDLFQPIEDCIRNEFIPALVGRAVSDTERLLFSLPTKLGGLNIPNPVRLCSKEYEWSQNLTMSLTEKIKRQTLYEEDSPDQIKKRHNQVLRQIKAEKITSLKTSTIPSVRI